MKMHEPFTSCCCDLLRQIILILSTVFKECQRSSGEIAGGHGLAGRVCASYEITSHKVTNSSASGRGRDWSVCSMQCSTELKFLALNWVTCPKRTTCPSQHQDPQLKNEVCPSPSQLKDCLLPNQADLRLS